jgi:hypothetical protein
MQEVAKKWGNVDLVGFWIFVVLAKGLSKMQADGG